MPKRRKTTNSDHATDAQKEKEEPSFIIDVKKIKEEQRVYFEGLKEIEKLKQQLRELDDVEEKTKKVEAEEVLSILTTTADTHPGIKVFSKKRRFQCFTLESLKPKFETTDWDYEEVLLFLQTKLFDNESLTEETLSQLFYVMSIESDVLACDSCHDLLVANIPKWVPKLEDIFTVFLNWGASYESLYLASCDKRIVFPNYVYLQPLASGDIGEFSWINFRKVLSYVNEVIKRAAVKYTECEILILLKNILKIALDLKFNSVRGNLQDCVFSCVESLKNWDAWKIMNVSAIIHNRREHFHNQVALVMEIIPKASKCNDISSCLSLAVLRFMVNPDKDEYMYTYPYSDADVLELVKSVKINPDSGEDLYKLYMIIHLLNHIVYHRNMIEVNQSTLQELRSIVDSLKWDVVRSKRVFDADLVKSRISYCSALWSLFRRNETHEL